jgi:hypothetical protein
MASPSYMTKTITILGTDGNHVSVSETPDRKEVVVAIQQNDKKGRIATARLSGEQFAALCGAKYELEIANETEVG